MWTVEYVPIFANRLFEFPPPTLKKRENLNYVNSGLHAVLTDCRFWRLTLSSHFHISYRSTQHSVLQSCTWWF